MTSKPGDRIANLRRRFPSARFFAGPAAEARSWRLLDAVALGTCAVALALLAVVTEPASGFELALQGLLASFPAFLDSLWGLGIDLLHLAALALVLVALVAGRRQLVRDMVLAAVLATVVALLASRLVEGAYPSLWEALRAKVVSPGTFPAMQLGTAGSVLMTATPHLARPFRRACHWLVWLGVLSVVTLGAATPSKALAGALLAIASAAGIHLVFGSVRGRPGTDEVQVLLAVLGVDTTRIGVAARQAAGDYVLDAEDTDGNPMLVKVYGRDAQDTAFLTNLWRTAWYRDSGAVWMRSRLHQVEHEALMTLLAGQAGVPTYTVVTAGAPDDGDAALVLRPHGNSLADSGGSWSPDLLARSWTTLGRLHAAGLVHGSVDSDHLFASGPDGGEVGLNDFHASNVSTASHPRLRDQAQLLMATVLGAGEADAIAAARAALGDDGLAAVLRFVQSPVLTPAQRRAVREADLDVDDLRDRVASSLELDPPELQKLRRVTVGSVLQTALLVLAFFGLARVAGGVDFVALADEIAGAAWWLVAAGFVLAQVPRVAQAFSAMGACPVPLSFLPVYALQLAISYISLVIPGSAGRIALNIRFFQRQGLRRGTAVAVGALDGFGGFIVQILTLGSLLAFTSATLDLDLDIDLSGGIGRVLVIVVGLGVVGAVAGLALPAIRSRLLERVRELLQEAKGALEGLQSPGRLGMLLGGNLGSDLFLALSLGAFVRSFGHAVGLGELLVIIISVSLLAGVIPIPGGIGVTEGGLIYGLVGAGVGEEVAFAAVILYRAASFYLPPVWGFFSLRWLERNDYV